MPALTPQAQSLAFDFAFQRKGLATGKSTAELREALDRSMRLRVHAMARVTNATFADEMKKLVDAGLKGGNQTSLAYRIAQAQATLARLGYTPEQGFQGDAKLGIPAAKPGSLQDLSSWKRLEFTFMTEEKLAHGRAQKLKGLDPVAMALFPAFELVRVGSRKTQRNWLARWVQAGGRLYQGRMIALKDDPIWHKLGDSAVFDDALDVDSPPFAFGSGMGWRAVSRAECIRLGVIDADEKPQAADRPTASAVAMPPPVITIPKAADPAVRSRLQALKQQSAAALQSYAAGRKAA